MAHKMRSDVVAALEGFIQDVNGSVDNVSIEMKGRLDSSRNTITQHKPGQPFGSRLVISVGDGSLGGPVTRYGLHVPQLGTRNDKARSLRLTPDKGRPAAMVLTGRPQEGKEGVTADPDAGERLERAYAMAANGMSFGWLYDGDPGFYLREKTKETDLFLKCLDEFDAGNFGYVEDAAGDTLGSSGPLLRMAAWSACSGVGVYGGTQEDIGPATKAGVAAARKAMGLDDLKAALERAGQGVPLDEALDWRTPEGRAALEGLACLGYYKCVMNEGRGFGEYRDGRAYAGTADDRESVFLRGAYARCEAAERAGSERPVPGYAPYACYRKVLGDGQPSDQPEAPQGGQPGQDGQKKAGKLQRVDLNMQYRFYRCAMLGEDPDGPSGAPDIRLTYRGDAGAKKVDARQIYVEGPSDDGRGTVLKPLSEELALLRSDLDDPGLTPRSRLHGFPMIGHVARTSGTDAVMDMAEKMVGADYSAGPDILEVEIGLFASDDKAGSRSRTGRPGEPTADSLWAKFQANAAVRLDGGPKPSGTRMYRYTRDHAVGVPDFSAGLSGFGELRTAGAGLSARDTSKDMLAQPRLSGYGKSASAFRVMDGDRRYMGALCGRGPGQPWREALAGDPAQAAADEYEKALALFGKDPDKIRGGLKINDLMVLTEAYRPSLGADIRDIRDDVERAYGPDAMAPGTSGLYRPANPAELKAIRSASEGASFRGLRAVPARMQGTADGFAEAMASMVDTDAGWRAVAETFRQEALEKDTFRDRRYWDASQAMLARCAPQAEQPPRQKMSRGDVLSELMREKDRTDEREAEMAEEARQAGDGGKTSP